MKANHLQIWSLRHRFHHLQWLSHHSLTMARSGEHAPAPLCQTSAASPGAGIDARYSRISTMRTNGHKAQAGRLCWPAEAYGPSLGKALPRGLQDSACLP